MSKKFYDNIAKEVISENYLDEETGYTRYRDAFFEDQIELLKKYIKDNKQYKKYLILIYILVCCIYVFFTSSVTTISVISISLITTSTFVCLDKCNGWIRDDEFALDSIKFSYNLHKIKVNQFKMKNTEYEDIMLEDEETDN